MIQKREKRQKDILSQVSLSFLYLPMCNSSVYFFKFGKPKNGTSVVLLIFCIPHDQHSYPFFPFTKTLKQNRRCLSFLFICLCVTNLFIFFQPRNSSAGLLLCLSLGKVICKQIDLLGNQCCESMSQVFSSLQQYNGSA